MGWSYLSRFGGEALNSDVFTILCCILISRSSRVFWRFKRRSCISYQWFALLNLLRRCVVHFIEGKTSSYLCQSFIAAAATTVGNMWGGVKC